MNYWMFKSEPNVFSVDHLQEQGSTVWDGIRNYQARIYLRSAQVDDLVFFYHSNCEITGVAGLCKVIESDVVDPTQFDPASDCFDEKSTPESPRWQTVKVAFVEKFSRIITLEELKRDFAAEELVVVRKGNRLSVMPVSTEAAEKLLRIARTVG